MADLTDDATTREKQKQEALERSLEGGRVQIRLDARRPGVRVPEKFSDEPMLALNLSWRFPNTEMVVNERGVAATLRFDGTPSRCVIPWGALFAVIPTTGEPSIWPADVPVEFGGPPRAADPMPEPPPVEPLRPRLSVVAGGIDETRPHVQAPEPQPDETPPPAESVAAEETAADETPPEPAATRAPWLRIVR